MTKPAKCHVRPATTQINLGIRLVWSESSLYAWRKLGSLTIHWAHSKDSDQHMRMPRLILVFTGRTCHFVAGSYYRIIWIRMEFKYIIKPTYTEGVFHSHEICNINIEQNTHKKTYTVEPRYLELAYFELPLISKWKSGPCNSTKLWQQVTK